MNHHEKPKQCHRPPPAYRQAFERLDIALAENSHANDLEKKDAVRRILFGRENVEAADAAQKIPEESKC